MSARIFQKPKNAMQSGRAQTDKWVLDFEPAAAPRPDPLTGWAGSADTRRQVKLMFPTLVAARAYSSDDRRVGYALLGRLDLGGRRYLKKTDKDRRNKQKKIS